MPSPIGHAIAGIAGFLVMRKQVPDHQFRWLFIGAIGIACLADVDVVPGLLLYANPTIFHHQAAHSLAAVGLIGLLTAVTALWFNLDPGRWSLWAGSVYGSHVALDLLVADPTPPMGEQLLWPFSYNYVIAPVTPLPRFDYFDPMGGIFRSLFSYHNFLAITQEILLLSPIACLAWYWASRNPWQRLSHR
jgi:inner membrane protein